MPGLSLVPVAMSCGLPSSNWEVLIHRLLQVSQSRPGGLEATLARFERLLFRIGL